MTRQMVDDAIANAAKADRLMARREGTMLNDERLGEILISYGYRPAASIMGAIRTAVAEAEAATREAAAKLIEDEEGWEWAYHTGDDPPFPFGRISYSTRHNIAAAVRACEEERDAE